MTRRFKNAEDELEALRQDPDFRALVEELKGQSPRQHDRLGSWFERQEKHNGRGDTENA